MKRKIKILTILLGLLVCASVFGKAMVYFKVSISEALMMYDIEGADELEFDATNSITTDIGFGMDITDASSLILLYELSYHGPGLRGYSQEGFSARSIDNGMTAKYLHKLTESLLLITKIDFFYEFYRLGKSEKWTDGLYNFGKFGGGAGVDYTLFKNNTLSGMLNLHYFWFPNYDDIMKEAIYLLEGNTDLPADSLNHRFLQLGINVGDKWIISKHLYLRVNTIFNYRHYFDLTVDDIGLDPLNNKKQRDYIYEFQAAAGISLLNFIMIEGYYTFTYYKSNYNYLSYEDLTTGDYDYVEDYSSHTEQSFAVPVTLRLSGKSLLRLTPAIEYKKYASRSPKNKQGEFKEGKQNNLALSGSVAWIYKNHKHYTFSPIYIFRMASSNSHDPVMSYNYTAHYFGVQITFEY